MRNLDDMVVRDGKIIRELSEGNLDNIIERLTNRLLHITNQIQELRDRKTEIQAKLDKANQLKVDLNK